MHVPSLVCLLAVCLHLGFASIATKHRKQTTPTMVNLTISLPPCQIIQSWATWGYLWVHNVPFFQRGSRTKPEFWPSTVRANVEMTLDDHFRWRHQIVPIQAVPWHPGERGVKTRRTCIVSWFYDNKSFVRLPLRGKRSKHLCDFARNDARRQGIGFVQVTKEQQSQNLSFSRSL